jgi:hypothetical protein
VSKNKIIPQMFDVRPVDEAGDLDWKKIQSVGCIGDEQKWNENTLRIEKENNSKRKGELFESERRRL